MKFEGPEKKLEIILKHPRTDLRGNPDGIWDKVVASALTKIVHTASNRWFDAHLLSESSLFVYDNRIIMITCGKSQLFRAVPTLLGFIHPSEIANLFYERKNFLYPKEQISDFEYETKDIANMFPGSKFQFGPEDSDHIYVYLGSPGRNGVPLNARTLELMPREPPPSSDITLEILMHGMPDHVAQQFYYDPNMTIEDVRRHSGIQFLFDQEEIAGKYSILYDDYRFMPCGYSLNALLDKSYFTIHVTPQDICSYVSFETNVLLPDYTSLIQKVLNCFTPQRFTMVFTYNDPACMQKYMSQSRFSRTSSQEMELGEGYSISFANFQKEPSYSELSTVSSI